MEDGEMINKSNVLQIKDIDRVEIRTAIMEILLSEKDRFRSLGSTVKEHIGRYSSSNVTEYLDYDSGEVKLAEYEYILHERRNREGWVFKVTDRTYTGTVSWQCYDKEKRNAVIENIGVENTEIMTSGYYEYNSDGRTIKSIYMDGYEEWWEYHGDTVTKSGDDRGNIFHYDDEGTSIIRIESTNTGVVCDM